MIIALMGVSGSGKTTIGTMLAESLGWKYFDADEFHPRANIEKMKTGVPLNDADRQPWLEQLQQIIRDSLEKGEPAVLACSALRQCYRDMLLVDERVRLVYLKGDYKLIEARLRRRRDHYMNPKLLDSQFEALEEPKESLQIDITRDPSKIVADIRNQLDL